MIVNLIKAKQMFSVTLPEKIKGQYWISDVDDSGKTRNLISIEAVKGTWVLKSNRLVTILDANNQGVERMVLQPLSFFNLKIANSDERVILFSEPLDDTRKIFYKYVLKEPTVLEVGRNAENNICYKNRFVSGKHASLIFDGNTWAIRDESSTNGTYVNGFRVREQNLAAGDFIYIMGLKVVVGYRFLAINNPDGMSEMRADNLFEYRAQTVEELENTQQKPSDIEEMSEPDYFFRSPRFHREIEEVFINIDPPPAAQKMETVPMALMLGPSVTMAMTSVTTAFFTVNNTLANGGNITSAVPTIIMAVSMLCGSLLWPVLTKKYEKKQKIKTEQKRQQKYLAYLDEIRDQIRRYSKEQSDILRDNVVTLEECAERISQKKINLWERTVEQSDFLRLRVGVGTLPLLAQVKCPEKKFTMDEDNLQDAMLSLGNEEKLLTDVPISISLVAEQFVGIIGNRMEGKNLLKSLILQMVSLHSYDELKIVLLVDDYDEKEWGFTKWLPHLWNDEKTIRFLATNADETKELSAYLEKAILSRSDANGKVYSDWSPYYVIIATGKGQREKCSVLQQLLSMEENYGFSILLYGEELKDLPKETKTIVMLNDKESRIFAKDDTTGKSQYFKKDIFNEAVLAGLSEQVANIELDRGSNQYSLPNMITFLEMFGVGKIEHLNSLTRWKENNPTITLQTPVGVGTTGDIFQLDLHEKFHGPHGLVAGMTGSGKSEFIITYILSLAVNYHPDEVAFILIDYKGGGLTGAFEDEERGIKLPHLAGTITNLDGAAVKRALTSIQSELRRRQSVFNEARRISNEGTMDIYKYQQLYRDGIVKEAVPHLFIISDEFAELKTQQPEFMEQLISAARIGRSLGVHLILATQKPSGVVDDQIWSNSKFRVCLKVQEKADSQDMIKCSDAAELSQTGRFYLQVGFNELFALGQSAWCGAPYNPVDVIEKTKDTTIQVVDHIGRVIMNVKPEKKQRESTRKIKQIVAVVKYLSDLAEEEAITVRSLWLPPIPAFICVDDMEKKYSVECKKTVLNPVVGEYDDPCNQRQDVLTIPLSTEGNCLLYGSAGNGKTTFLTTLCYSLIKNHNAEEVNIYIMDFGSETLKIFEKAPQVGDVILAVDEEKTLNLIKMLNQEITLRKNLFSEYGGDYESYCKNSGKVIPNIVILLNNYAGFAEQYEDLQEVFSVLTRDGVKYGIYFVVTASSVNAVRYKTVQNFKQVMTMQLNDATDYSVAIGKTDGLVPSKYKGRGLVNLEGVYEFQTAHCTQADSEQDFLRNYCRKLAESSTKFAKRIPILPEVVNTEYIEHEQISSSFVPVGVGKRSLELYGINLTARVAYPVVMQDIYQAIPFTEELIRMLHSRNISVTLYDTERMLSGAIAFQCRYLNGDPEKLVQEWFSEMVARNNDYKDSGLESSSMDKYTENIYIVLGMKKMYDQLSADGKEKFSVLLDKAEVLYKMRFIMIDAVHQFSSFSMESWYKRQITGSDGLWIGEGVADQYMLKLNKVTTELYDEIGREYGYMIIRNRPTLIKLLSSRKGEKGD